MNTRLKQVKPGDIVISPAGRELSIRDIVVPRNARALQSSIPSQFRNSSRKIVIFENDTVTTLAEVNCLYKIIDDTIH
ncbi:MAG: hypothetical protein ACI90U_003099 [Pseudomonadales bacterium]|jgi:hypothetical protein